MNPKDEIKNKLPIEELVSEYLSLKPAGAYLKALCPFHAEKTPSFIVTPARGTFHCFGCGKHGDIFTFLQEMEGVDFKEALRILAEKTSVNIENYSFDRKSNKESDNIKKILKSVHKFYQDNLKENEAAKDYLKDRGLSDSDIQHFALGFAPDSWDAAYNFLLSLGFATNEIEKTGVIKKGSSGKYYDRLRSRIIFPIWNDKDELVAFTGRIFAKNSDGAKYINSPESELYKKSDLLYAYNFAKQAIRKLDFTILVEGQMDVIAMHKSGFPNTVALSGTAFTDKQLALISRFSKNLLFALDSDDAGIGSMLKNCQKLFPLGFNVKALKIPKGQDPADVYKEQGEKHIKRMVKEAVNIIDFFIDYYADLYLPDREKYARILRSRVLPLLATYDSELEKELAAEKIAFALSLSKEAVLADLANITTDGESMSVKTPLAKTTQDINEDITEKIELLFFWVKSLNDSVLKNKRKILTELNGLIEAKDLEKLDYDPSDESLAELDKVYFSVSGARLEIMIRQDLDNLKRLKYKEDLRSLTQKMKEAEGLKDEEAMHLIGEKIKHISEKLSNL